jgi:hypothetical protein
MIETIEREIVELHDFFADWLTGRLDDTDAIFDRAAAALDPAFQLVAPSGDLTEMAPLLDQIRAGHGSRPNFTIGVDQIRARQVGGGLWLATYYEHQTTPDGATRRISSALLARDQAAPLGVSWLHVHETWA